VYVVPPGMGRASEQNVPTKKSYEMNLEKWLAMGIEKGFCSPLYCENHDTVYYEDWERYMELVEEYDARDFCWPIVRIYNGGDA
jgi:hypothetical protein